MQQKQPPLTDNQRTEWAYELVDDLLNRLSKENEAGIRFSIHTKVGQEAIKIVKSNGLANFSGSFLLGAILTITDKGKDVISAGGIKEYLRFWNIKKANIMH